MALTNNFIGTINFVAVLLSIPIIDVRIWLTTEPGDSCVKVLLWPAIILGVLILVVALAGFVGAFWRIPTLLSGCCKPPTKCGYTFVNPTYWISPINTAEDMDCMKWSNDQAQLCYNCDSCKVGLLATLEKGQCDIDRYSNCFNCGVFSRVLCL
ncbi:hypothetical protein JHK85_023163 [Glycine max]|nr:hypothetical protein JHK85_023163 [Glycine max]